VSGYEPPASATSNRGRIVLAALASVLLLGSLVLSGLAGGARSRARVTKSGSSAATAQLTQMAATVEASIARQSRQAAVQQWEAAHHEVADPADPAPAAQQPAIAGVERVVKRWMGGYLPYEVDELTASERRDLEATSIAPLARSLLSSPPLIPSTRPRPPQGLLVDLITTFTSGGHESRVYTEIAYGPEQIGFYLTLRPGGPYGWLVAALHV
jgi:hypothetical protein